MQTAELFRSRIRHLHIREWFGSGFLPYSRDPSARDPHGMGFHCPGYVVLGVFAYKAGRESSWKEVEVLAIVIGRLGLRTFFSYA